VYRDLQYATYSHAGSQQSLLLDLYLPAQASSRHMPVLVYLHGGGWFEGSKENCPAMPFVQEGYAVACVDYRLAEADGCPAEFTFPVQIQDVKTAVRWLRSQADAYHLDVDHFGVLGDSSGGHLAALLGTSSGVGELAGTQHAGYSDGVQAVCDWYGPVDIRTGPVVFPEDACTVGFEVLSRMYGGEETPYFYWTFAWSVFLGGSLADPAILDAAGQATPLSYVDAQDPPFLVIHGESDGMVPIAQSQQLADALVSAGADVTFLRLPEVGHGYSSPEHTVLPAFLDPSLAFFELHLKN
jgi:acetyl esterase/lipase